MGQRWFGRRGVGSVVEAAGRTRRWETGRRLAAGPAGPVTGQSPSGPVATETPQRSWTVLQNERASLVYQPGCSHVW